MTVAQNRAGRFRRGLRSNPLLFPLDAAGWPGRLMGTPSFGSTAPQTACWSWRGVFDNAPAAVTAAARRLRYSTLECSVPAPTLHSCARCGVREPFGRAHAIAFGAIWTALALYVIALARSARAPVTEE